jgi:hypothetical protein
MVCIRLFLTIGLFELLTPLAVTDAAVEETCRAAEVAGLRCMQTGRNTSLQLSADDHRIQPAKMLQNDT